LSKIAKANISIPLKKVGKEIYVKERDELKSKLPVNFDHLLQKYGEILLVFLFPKQV